MTAGPSEIDSNTLPPDMQRVRDAAFKALGILEPAGTPRSEIETRGMMLASPTSGGRTLPEYYLVYFLLVDLLEFPNLGQWQKTAWRIPVRYCGRIYGIEHTKMGLGIFAPTLDKNASRSATPSEEAETDARTISNNAVVVAEPYFEWRAEMAASTNRFNVHNRSERLFERYEFFRNRFNEILENGEFRSSEIDNKAIFLRSLPIEAEWNAQAAIEAFFSWTEHVFIHLAVLQGQLHSGNDVARLAQADWKTKFKSALDISDAQTKKHYDSLLDLRAQIRNFMAHGAFGKRGEAFRFHSGAGAVPVLLTGHQEHRYSLTGTPEFDERGAIADIEQFIEHLWSGSRLPARHYVLSRLPSILTFVDDGTYARAMRSEENMKEVVGDLWGRIDRAVNMDW